jgi:N-acetylneuraminic acid mutarotase
MHRFSLVPFVLVALALALVPWPTSPTAHGQGNASDGTWGTITPPVARRAHTAVWDPVNAQLLVFGGQDNTTFFRNDLWAYRPAHHTWVLLSPAGGPPTGRRGHAAVWDPVNGQMLVFGGQESDASVRSDLWAFRPAGNGGAWVLLAPTGGPPGPRVFHTAVWDAANSQMLVFGGQTTSAGSSAVNALWAYRPAGNAGTWVQLSPSGGSPPARAGAAAAWDAVSGQMLVFGGLDAGSARLNDLWAHQPAGNAGSWALLTPAGGPPTPRVFHTAAWDPVGAQMLVFGGSGNGNVSLNDLWAYRPGSDAETWTLLGPAGGPPAARSGHAATWDRTGARMLISGGTTSAPQLLDDLWAYQPAANAGTWARLSLGGGPPDARERHTAVWAAAGAQMLVFGGVGGRYPGGLWAYRPASNSWVLLSPTGSAPDGREEHSAAWDIANVQMLVFGGFRTQVNNELWAYRPAGDAGAWVQLSPTGGLPTARRLHSAVWDATAAQMLVFGGRDATLVTFNELWAYRPAGDTGAWVTLSPTGPIPAARYEHTAVWDAANAQMLVFGGRDAVGTLLNDLWAYRPAGDTGTWVQLSPGGTLPPARGAHSGVWDAANGQMLVFGGADSSSSLNDLWAYRPAGNAGTWVALSPTGAPPTARTNHAAAWNPSSARMLVFGGKDNSNQVLDDLRIFDPASAVPPTPTPTLTATATSTATRTSTATSTATLTATTTATPILTATSAATSTATTTPTSTLTATPTTTNTISRTPTSTSTVLPGTAMPTRTATATATPYPQPNVGVVAQPSTAGRLQVTLRARDAGCTPNNQLASIEFSRLTNATVEVPGLPPTTVTAPRTVALAGGPTQVTLTVVRTSAGQASTVDLVVTDGCGTWPTFVGGGPGAF